MLHKLLYVMCDVFIYRMQISCNQAVCSDAQMKKAFLQCQRNVQISVR